MPIPPPSRKVLSTFKPVKVSSGSYKHAQRLVDDCFKSRWGTELEDLTEEQADNQWVEIDLQRWAHVRQLFLVWDVWARMQKVESRVLLSDDAQNWRPVTQRRQAEPAYGIIDLEDAEGRYVRLELKKRARRDAVYMIKGIQVLGDWMDEQP